MPLWRVFSPRDFYSAADKAALSEAITRIYAETSPSRLPRFYVNVVFQEYGEGEFFLGGEPQNSFVRFAGEHIARHMTDDETERMARFMGWFEDAVRPWTEGRSASWEVHIGQTPRELWRVGGLVPPPAESAGEDLWRKENAPVPYN